MERWFVTYDGKMDEVQFGPLASKDAAIRVRSVIEVVEGHEDLWVLRDDDHPWVYDRELTAPRCPAVRRPITAVQTADDDRNLPNEGSE